MLQRVLEFFYYLKLRVFPDRKQLSVKAAIAKREFVRQIAQVKRKTSRPIIIWVGGLVGAGKTRVARLIVQEIGGTVIEHDQIRVELRKQGERYRYVRKISEDVIEEIIRVAARIEERQKYGNIVIDADFMDPRERASMRLLARRLKVPLLFIRAQCDPHTMIGRMITAHYENKPDNFFGGAKTTWKDPPTEQARGATIKIGEFWRRTPHHHCWSLKGGGTWKLKKPPVRCFSQIDTTDPDAWQREVGRLGKQLRWSF